MKKPTIFISCVLLITCIFSAHAADAFYSTLDTILKKYVHFGKVNDMHLTLVDYQAIKRDPLYKRTLTLLQQTSVSELAGDEKKAFWINAYNILAIKMVLDHYPVDSIKDAGSFFTQVWDKEVISIRDKAYTLNEIEHKILRPLGDPRIHFAIVCASLSCPNMRKESFSVDKLDSQLDDQTKTFLANTTKGLHYRQGELVISKIFSWFEKDFKEHNGVRGFLKKYLPKNLRKKYDPQHDKIEYLDYDWSLNDTQRMDD